jgi:hypothetical protein
VGCLADHQPLGSSRVGWVRVATFLALAAAAWAAAPAAAHQINPLPGMAIDCGSYPHDHDEDEPASTFTLLKAAAQDLVEPHLRGISYDPVFDRLYVAACDRREFACDILQIDSRPGAPDDERLSYLKLDGRYGYAWPSVSPDGRRLVAVRTDRRARPSQDHVGQELIQIDLATGSISVLAHTTAGDRFERTAFLGDNIALWRSFKTSPQLGCRGDYCTDRIGLDLIKADGERLRAAPTDVWPGGAALEAIPIGPDLFMVFGSVKPGAPNPTPFALIDTRGDLRMTAFRLSTELLAEVERNAADRLSWPREMIARFRPLSNAPACLTDQEFADDNQSAIFSDSRAVYLIKTPYKRKIYFDITWRERDERLPWAPYRKIRVAYPNYYGNPLAKEIERGR